MVLASDNDTIERCNKTKGEKNTMIARKPSPNRVPNKK